MSAVTDLIRDDATSSTVRDAWLAADAAARSAGIEIRTLDHLDDLESVRRLYEGIWGTGEANPPVTADLLKAMTKAGSYVGGAYDAERLVGACFGFFSAPAREALHSHIAGVLASMQGRNVGFALKLHQRAWALSRGVRDVAWTFDPLIRRNAYFNIAKLAAEPIEYLPDFYGPMDDDINRSDPTDRLLVRWDLASELVVDACARRARPTADAPSARAFALRVAESGAPASGSVAGPVVLVGVPDDIESLRERDPARAADWRLALREVLGGLVAGGGRVRTFDRNGWYVVDTEER